MSAIDEYVGFSGTGSFRQSGGTNGTSYFNLGENYSSGNGTYYLSGGQLSAGNEYLGYSGSGTFTQSGGTNTASGLYLSEYSASEAEYNLNGGLLVLGALAQGSRTAVFNFSGGTLKAGRGFSTAVPLVLLGGATFDTAGYAVTLSGSLSGAGSLTKVDSGTLTLATANTFTGNTLISGGMLVLGDSLALQYSTLDTSGSGVISFGTYAATFGGLTGSGTLNIASLVGLSVGSDNGSTTCSGMLKGSGSLTKIGNGVLLLSGSDTYTGATTVNQGELDVNGSLVSPVTVNSGGILGGTGSLSSVTINPSGQIAPGSPLGTLALSGSLVLATGAVFDYDLDKPVTSDTITCGQVVVAIPLRFSNFSFAYTSKFGPGVYDLIQSDTALPASILGGSTSGSVDGLPATLAVQGNNLVLNVVPEPGALAMLGAGVLGLLGWCRQRAARIEP